MDAEEYYHYSLTMYRVHSLLLRFGHMFKFIEIELNASQIFNRETIIRTPNEFNFSHEIAVSYLLKSTSISFPINKTTIASMTTI